MSVFSARSTFDLTVNRLQKLRAEIALQGKTWIDLTSTNPTVTCPTLSDAELAKLLATSSTAEYKPQPLGSAVAREAIVELYRTRGIHTEKQHVGLCSSTSEAYGWLFRLLCNPGDEILVPRPSYPLFSPLAQLDGLVLRKYDLFYEGEWHIDFQSIERAHNAKTRALIAVSPNNPTGSYVTPTQWSRICSYACPVIVDEVFVDYPLRSACARALPDSDRTLTFFLDGLSKTAALPQLKLAWFRVGGPAPLRAEALHRLEHIADTFLPVSVTQHALPNILARKQYLQAAVQQRIETNLRCAQQLLDHEPASVLHVEGGWSMILRLPNIQTDEQWACQLLAEQGIYTHPGYLYDIDTLNTLVISLLPRPAEFETGIRTIRDHVRRLT